MATTGKTAWGHATTGGSVPNQSIATSGSRPTDGLDLGDYLWWMLPGYLKRPGRTGTRIGAVVAAWGDVLAEARYRIATIVPSWLPQTAKGTDLDELGSARGVPRETGECDGTYRPRVLSAWRTAISAGTPGGLVAALAHIGLTVHIWEPWVASATTWNPPAIPVSGVQYLVPVDRPHACDSGESCDDGHFCDATDSATGAWATHGGQLAVWTGESWGFIVPPAHFVVAAADEDYRVYLCDGDRGVSADPGFSTWAHAIVQLLSCSDTSRATPSRFTHSLLRNCPAHTRLLIVSEIEPVRCDSRRTCDDGHTCDWIAA